MFEITLKTILTALFFLIFLHAYLATKKISKSTLGYPIFYTGIVLISLAVLFAPIYPALIVSTAVYVLLLGTGLIVRSIKLISIRDFLTDLYTRNYFYNEWLPREIKRQERSNGQITFLMLDIDNFKSLNDSKGHIFGDKLLKDVSKIILSSIRATDIAVRFGGDEILIALPGTSPKEAKKIAERISKNIENARTSNLPLITLSIGFATWKPGKNIEEVINEADKRMYNHKAMKKLFNTSNVSKN